MFSIVSDMPTLIERLDSPEIEQLTNYLNNTIIILFFYNITFSIKLVFLMYL